MISQKKEFLQQSIRRAALGKKKGQIGWAAGLFLLLFLAVFLCAFQQMELYRTASLYLEDALAASNLASAVVDLEEYGISHRILIADPEASYEYYQWAVRENLNLDDVWESWGGGVVHSPVCVMDYTIYNVDGNVVQIYHYDENGVLTNWQEALGQAAAPNGRLIENTSVYSELTFVVKGLFGVEVTAHKGSLVDVAR